MKLTYQENPKEWRKSAWLTALGLALMISVLRWRRHLPANVWAGLLIGLGMVALAALAQPRWFRGWYRLSLWLGFRSSQFLGRGVLAGFFLLIITPLGLGLRLAGKDLLQLRRSPNAVTYWHPSRARNPLDRLF